MKLRRVEVGESVARLLDRSRLTQVAWETLAIVGLILADIGHMGGDIHESDNRWIRPGFRDDGSAVAMTDEQARSVLLSEDAFRCRHVVLKGGLRLLHDTYLVTIFGEN